MTDAEVASRMTTELAPARENGILALSGAAGEKAVRDAWEKAGGGELLEPLRQKLRLIVAGTPGGGTAYIARLLTACGARAGHERCFQCGGAPQLDVEHPIEVSGFAQQWLPLFEGVPVVRLVRHPTDMVNSCRKHLGWSAETAANYWLGTHGLALPSIRLEDQCERWVANYTGLPLSEVIFRSRLVDRNEHQPPSNFQPTKWADLSDAARWLAREFGYSESGLDT